MNMDIFQLFFNYLEERPYNNIHQNVKQDADYLEATIQENKLNEQYKKLDLSDEQRKSEYSGQMPSKHRKPLTRLWFSAWACNTVFPYRCNWLTYNDRKSAVFHDTLAS